MIGTLLMAFALLPQQAPAEQAAAEWKTDLAAGKKAMSAREYVEAAAKFRSALAQADAAQAEDAAALEALRGCATASRLLGRLEDAELFLSRASVLTETVHGSAGVELANVLSELATVQRSRGKRSEALASLQRAIRIREALGGDKLEDLARDTTSLATLELALGDAKAAEETLTGALALWDRVVAPDSPRLLPVLDTLGGIHRDNAQYAKAESCYARALMVREAALGPDSSELLSNLDSLAYVYFGQKKFADAEPVYKRLLALWEANAGPEHPMVALTYDKMAEFYAFQQRYEEAEKMATAALAIRTAAYMTSLNQTGRVLLMEAKLDQAQDLYRRAIEIGDLAKAPDEIIDPVLRIYAKILRELKRDGADAIDKRVKDALIRKADREGRLPSPVHLPAGK